MRNAPYATQIEQTDVARIALIGGTRQIIHEDEFSALVALLVDCGAVPRNVMALTLRKLADGMIAKARGQLETDYLVYPAELFDRARILTAKAATLSALCSADAQMPAARKQA